MAQHGHRLNELSPRKVPRTPIAPPKTPPQWKKPDEVMRRHRSRVKQQALAARMNSSSLFAEPSSQEAVSTSGVKRKNPFQLFSQEVKRVKEEETSDRSIYSLLGIADPTHDPLNINDLLKKIQEDHIKEEAPKDQEGAVTLPVDWSVRTKLRFMALSQFPWTQTLKTCEEASGLTAFVRCVKSGSEGLVGLDTSPNAVFHQCCLYWQHPSLPWLQLFPRGNLKAPPLTDKLPTMTAHPKLKESLHRDWTESLRSLFQLVRTRHCPYFYLFANHLTCVFRAAGVNGCSQNNVMITPTTVGFRHMLKEEGIEYSMPLRKKDSQRRSGDLGQMEENEELDLDIEEDDDVNTETNDWLASLGVEAAEIKRISSSEEAHELAKKKKIDGDYDSLIYMEGVEAQALINFLINCRSIVPTTGPLAGVPPTLIAPVAFSGATLSTLKVRESLVKVDSESYHSIEIRGPILPHTILNLSLILKDYLEKFSVTLSTIDHTKAFSISCKGKDNKESTPSDDTACMVPAFGQESLSDCGLQPETLARLCTQSIDCYDVIKCHNSLYQWT